MTYLSPEPFTFSAPLREIYLHPVFSGGRGRPPFYECSQWEFPTFSFPLKIYGFQGVRFLNRHWYFSRQLEPV